MSTCQQCKSDEGTEELHTCPYQEEINNEDEPSCNCCGDCEYQCAMDV